MRRLAEWDLTAWPAAYISLALNSLLSLGGCWRFYTPTYISLLNWTDQGIKGIKDTAKRVENAKALARKLGGKLDVHYTMGEYDAVSVVEMPSDEAYNKFALQIGMLGNMRSKTLKAWTLEEFQKLLDQI